MTVDGSSCPWPGTCEPVDTLRDLWTTRATGHGHTGPAGVHRHDHTRCQITPAGPVHPDDHGQPHPECAPTGHPTGLEAWPAAVYAIIGQMGTPTRTRRVWTAVMETWATPDDLWKATTADIATVVRPAGLATRKAVYLHNIAGVWITTRRPADTLETGTVAGFGESTVALWLSTMRP